MKTIFDIGMYDGSDTLYFLELGDKVVAIEANRLFVERGKKKFKKYLDSGQLDIINAAIMEKSGMNAELILSNKDLGSSTILPEMINKDESSSSVSVVGTTIKELIDDYGVPYYLKIDIEGADRFCVLPLTADEKPSYMSFEV